VAGVQQRLALTLQRKPEAAQGPTPNSLNSSSNLQQPAAAAKEAAAQS
jgi:hypothetical protein